MCFSTNFYSFYSNEILFYMVFGKTTFISEFNCYWKYVFFLDQLSLLIFYSLGNFFGVLIGSILSPVLVPDVNKIPLLVCFYFYLFIKILFFSVICKCNTCFISWSTFSWYSISTTTYTIMQSSCSYKTTVSISIEKSRE